LNEIAENNNAVVYLDPPYCLEQGLYEEGLNFTTEDHQNLRATVDKLRGQWFVSYCDCPEIRELWAGTRVYEYQAVYTTCKTEPVTELVYFSTV
jgi:DNA adenine methylase